MALNCTVPFIIIPSSSRCDLSNRERNLKHQIIIIFAHGMTYLCYQQLATSFSPKPDDMFHALKNVNLAKNRILDLVPLSVKRVLLPVQPGVDGSDYINATYLQVLVFTGPLTLSTLGKIPPDVSSGDNLHEMSTLVFWGK